MGRLKCSLSARPSSFSRLTRQRNKVLYVPITLVNTLVHRFGRAASVLCPPQLLVFFGFLFPRHRPSRPGGLINTWTSQQADAPSLGVIRSQMALPPPHLVSCLSKGTLVFRLCARDSLGSLALLPPTFGIEGRYFPSPLGNNGITALMGRIFPGIRNVRDRQFPPSGIMA